MNVPQVKPVNFKNFLNLIFGGFLLFKPTVQQQQQWRRQSPRWWQRSAATPAQEQARGSQKRLAHRRRRRHCCSSSVQCAGLRSEAVADFDKEEPLLLQKKHSAPQQLKFHSLHISFVGQKLRNYFLVEIGLNLICIFNFTQRDMQTSV